MRIRRPAKLKNVPKDEESNIQALVETTEKYKVEFDRAISQQQKNTERLLMGVIEAMDAFDRIFASIRAKDNDLSEQMKMWVGNFRTVRRLLLNSLNDQQVFLIEQSDEEFDPTKQHVCETREDPSRPDGAILEEVQPGYSWRGHILRKAHVIVARHPERPNVSQVDCCDTQDGSAAKGRIDSDKADGDESDTPVEMLD